MRTSSLPRLQPSTAGGDGHKTVLACSTTRMLPYQRTDAVSVCLSSCPRGGSMVVVVVRTEQELQSFSWLMELLACAPPQVHRRGWRRYDNAASYTLNLSSSFSYLRGPAKESALRYNCLKIRTSPNEPFTGVSSPRGRQCSFSDGVDASKQSWVLCCLASTSKR